MLLYMYIIKTCHVHGEESLTVTLLGVSLGNIRVEREVGRLGKESTPSNQQNRETSRLPGKLYVAGTTFGGTP